MCRGRIGVVVGQGRVGQGRAGARILQSMV